ncbi:MAG TPA: glycosyltransferase family 39 protein, partial [Candidatus Humimicrobiaceae bacterium]|nr:glycosyltransferase family 39 protein [Candidatus Humimicrobiaceae bacterium]
MYFCKIGSIPNGFYVDEAAVAYNAYSIEQTGKDIFDQSYPILFRLLGSYTPPLFIYVSAAFIHFIGSDPYVFRIISGISALISIVFFYLTVRKLNIYRESKTALIITFFYAISPWLVFNARLGYEVTLGYAIFNMGFYFMLLAIEKPINLIWGLTILSLSTYASHTQRYLVPIFLLFYFLILKREVINTKNLKLLVFSFLAALIIQIPNLTVINTRAFWVKNARLTEQSTKNIITNIVNQTFSYLSPKSLFYELPDIDMQHTIPDISVMPNFLVIPYLIGIYLMFRRVREKKILLLLMLFFVTLIPAILSGEFISIQRALPFLLPLGIVIGLGIDYIIIKLDRRFFFVIFVVFSS